MAITTTFSCFITLLLILPIFGRSVHRSNIEDYARVVETSVEQTLPTGMTIDFYNNLVISYWTPERMASAKPMDLLMIDDSTSFNTTNYSPLPMDDKHTPVRSAVAGVPPRSLKAAPSVIGKVYGRMGASNYVCSGSVIVSENQDTLLTAGHCIWDSDTQAWASELIFVPQYSKGSRPLGTWVWRTFAALNGWTQYEDFNYDVAVVLVATSNEGEHIEDITGALGMTRNWDRQAQTVAYGYPVNIYDGEQMSSCSGQSAPAAIAQFSGMALSCNMKGGSSGGPWTQDGDQQTSVNSFGIGSRPDVMFGPYFGDAIWNLWEQYQNQ